MLPAVFLPVFRKAALPLALAGLTACGPSTARPHAPPKPAPRTAARYPGDDASWVRYSSKRFRLSFPLPDGKAWRIDDRSQPALTAVHEPTDSRVLVLATREDELVNRQKCEARARALGWIPSTPLATVDDEATVGPETYDSRIWVALDVSHRGAGLDGHVYLFGARVRQCLLVHVSTHVASAQEEDILSERLALARARIVRGLVLDATRTTDDAALPRSVPAVRR